MTLNQTIKTLRNIVLNHAQVNSYYFGELSNWSSFPGLTYPSCLITLNDAVLNLPKADLNLSMWLSDRVNFDHSNTNEVFSDTLQILSDLVSEMNHPDYDWFPDIVGKPITFFEDARSNDNADVVAGVKIDFGISIHSLNGSCVAPLRNRKFIVTESGLYIASEDGEYVFGMEN